MPSDQDSSKEYPSTGIPQRNASPSIYASVMVDEAKVFHEAETNGALLFKSGLNTEPVKPEFKQAGLQPEEAFDEPEEEEVQICGTEPAAKPSVSGKKRGRKPQNKACDGAAALNMSDITGAIRAEVSKAMKDIFPVFLNKLTENLIRAKEQAEVEEQANKPDMEIEEHEARLLVQNLADPATTLVDYGFKYRQRYVYDDFIILVLDKGAFNLEVSNTAMTTLVLDSGYPVEIRYMGMVLGTPFTVEPHNITMLAFLKNPDS